MFEFFATPTGIAVIAPVGSFLAGLIGAGISASTLYRTHRQRLLAEDTLAVRKFEFEKELAERRVQLDLSLVRQKRRAELAATVLADFYQVRDIYSNVRAPMVWAGEMVPEEGDSELVKEASYAPIKRLSHHTEFLARFWSREYEFAALFGDEAREPYHYIRSVSHEIRWAVDDLLRLKREGFDKQNSEQREKAYNTAFRYKKPDLITTQIDEAVAKIERINQGAAASSIRDSMEIVRFQI